MKRCNSCGKFPFCEMSKGPTDICDDYTKREIEMYLKNKKNNNFEFKKIKDE